MSAANGYDWGIKLDALAEALDLHAGDMRSRVAYLEAGLPRIEQVWHDQVLLAVEIKRLGGLIADLRDKISHLIGVTSHRFDLLNNRVSRTDRMLELLLAAAGLEAPQ